MCPNPWQALVIVLLDTFVNYYFQQKVLRTPKGQQSALIQKRYASCSTGPATACEVDHLDIICLHHEVDSNPLTPLQQTSAPIQNKQFNRFSRCGTDTLHAGAL
jgi:hypothetical protein